MIMIANSKKTQPNVLLVDDKDDNLFSLSNILRDETCHVLISKSGKECLNLMLKQEIACILLDIQMPEIDGFMVAKTIRQTNKNTPIVFVTAYDITHEQSKLGFELGILDYLIKPLSPNIVRAKVMMYCKLYQTNKEVEQLRNQNGIINDTKK